MTVLRPEIDQPAGYFAQFPRSWRMDKRITGIPRDVLLHLWDNAAGWKIHHDTLMADTGLSKYALNKALKVLRECGYLTDPAPEHTSPRFPVHHVITDPFADQNPGGYRISTPPPLENETPTDTNPHTKNNPPASLLTETETPSARSAHAAPPQKKSPRKFRHDPARAAAKQAAVQVHEATGANIHGCTRIIRDAVDDYGVSPEEAAHHLIELGTTGKPVTKASLATILDPATRSIDVQFAAMEALGHLKADRPHQAVAVAALEELTYHRPFIPTPAEADIWTEYFAGFRTPVTAAEAVAAVRTVAAQGGTIGAFDVSNAIGDARKAPAPSAPDTGQDASDWTQVLRASWPG